jgi:hypothetical protein
MLDTVHSYGCQIDVAARYQLIRLVRTTQITRKGGVFTLALYEARKGVSLRKGAWGYKVIIPFIQRRA